MGDGEREFVLVGVFPKLPVFTVVAYRPEDLDDLLGEQFAGCESRMLDPGGLRPHAAAEVRAVLEIAYQDGGRDGVVVGTTDGQGGWASWNLGLFAPTPGPVPELPDDLSGGGQ